MILLPLKDKTVKYLKKHKLLKKFEKQKALFEENPFYPSLNSELLEPRHLKIWSFRVDKKYRAIFIFHDGKTAEVLKVTLHYY
jgi:Txe/YoeB family toxin of Txe-Axe toxin-antitoxin module